MKALILAAGLGTRLGSLTADKPKPMLPVQGKPLLAHTVEWLRSHGVREIAFNLHHAPDVVPAYFGDGSAFGVHIVYSYEPTLLGTAGAAKKLEAFLDERFVIVYGDVFTNLDLTSLERFHAERLASVPEAAGGPAATLVLYRVDNPTQVGLVDVDAAGRIHRFVEKPPANEVFTDLANGGVIVVEPATLALIPPAKVSDFSNDIFPDMVRRALPLFGRAIAADEFLIDIGSPVAYERAQALPILSDQRMLVEQK